MQRLKRQQLVIIYTVVFLGLIVALVVKGFHKGGLYDADRSNDFRAYHLAAQYVQLDQDSRFGRMYGT